MGCGVTCSVSLCGRYKRHLRALYIVHPNWWLKVTMEDSTVSHLSSLSLALPPVTGLVVPDLHRQ